MRIKGGQHTKQRHKKYLKLAKGFRGGRRVLYRSAREGVEKGLTFAFRDRKDRKRQMRSLWITRISAASKALGSSYSVVINLLKKADINIDRKALSNMAATDPQAFNLLIGKVKDQMAGQVGA
ncbi:MAG: 50S ribosomal protein L20 [Deltaproteobacteria bacterium]|jgi:large subunit ribosomal protein L20|nr:50S ribosomal protein L20 [Deltaproteobacteria bacterium]